MNAVYLKDPSAHLDYKWNFAAESNGGDSATGDWLEDGETIIDHTITADTGITVDSSSITDAGTSVTAWLSGGTHRTDYTIACLITTSSTPARIDERSIMIKVRNQ